MEIAERILKIIDTKGLNKKTFSESIDLQPQTLHHIVGGRRTKPSFEVISKILSTYSDINERWLILGEGEMTSKKIASNLASNTASNSKKPYLLVPQVVTVDETGEENIPLVRSKAAAGYVSGYMEPEFISTLPAYRVPSLNNATFRMFEVSGNSMRPTLYSTDYVIGEWVEDLRTIRETRVYIIVTDEEVLVKRCYNRLHSEGKLICKSDNSGQGYPDIVLYQEQIKEAWYVRKVITGELAGPTNMYDRIAQLEGDMVLIKEKLSKLRQ